MKRLHELSVGLAVLAFAFTQMAAAATNYVDRYGTNPIANYTNWATAATSIQAAVDVAGGGNTVLVSNGVYDTGGKITPSYALTNRVCVTTAIILRSVNGPDYTSIKGQEAPGGGMGTGAVRCVYLANGASLIGFTLTNGYAMTTGNNNYDNGGAGVLIAAGGGSVSNCVIVGNYGSWYGGGAELLSGTLNNCIISNNNNSGGYGGGVQLNVNSEMNNCIVVGNSAGYYGGGVCIFSGKANNCLITGNTVSSTANQGGGGIFLWGSGIQLNSCTIAGNNSGSAGGGGVYFFQQTASLTNCIVWGNMTTGSGTNVYFNASATNFSYVCSGPVQAGTGNIGSDPQFVGAAGGNYRLKKDSPCVNTGINQSLMTGSADLDGHRRMDKFSGIVDMGCYEYIPKGMLFTIR